MYNLEPAVLNIYYTYYTETRGTSFRTEVPLLDGVPSILK